MIVLKNRNIEVLNASYYLLIKAKGIQTFQRRCCPCL